MKEKQNKNTEKEKSRGRQTRRNERRRSARWVIHLLIHFKSLNIPHKKCTSQCFSLSGLAVLSLDVTNSGNVHKIQLNWRITEVLLVQTFSKHIYKQKTSLNPKSIFSQ